MEGRKVTLTAENRESFKAGEMAMNKVPFNNLEQNFHPKHT